MKKLKKKLNGHGAKMNYLACTRQYKCNDCNNSFEFTWNAAVSPVPENVTCPKCSSKNVTKQTI